MNVDLVVFAVVATLSPLGFAATLAVLASGRLKAIVFAAAFLAGQLTACGALVLIDAALTLGHGRRFPGLRSALELALGLALLCLAAFVRARPDSRVASTAGSTALLDRLSRLRVGTAVAAGFALGVGGPKRLVLTALAAASIGASGADGGHAAVLVVAYTLIATLLVWVPILAFAILGDRAAEALHATERWLARRQRSVTVYSCLVVGAVAVADSLAELF